MCSSTCTVTNCEQCFLNDSNCYKCIDGLVRVIVNGEVTCGCPTNLILNVDTCDTPTDAQCAVEVVSGTCEYGFNMLRFDATLAEPTPGKYYLQGTSTEADCDPSCKTCALTANTCLSCHDQYVLGQDNSCICGPGFSHDSNGKCTACEDPYCFQCGDGKCHSCIGGYQLYQIDDSNSKCLPDFTCDIGTFFNAVTQTCDACACNVADVNLVTPNTCVGTADNCLAKQLSNQCGEGEVLGVGSVCMCQRNLYRNDNGDCVPCGPNCHDCNDNGTCNVCTNNVAASNYGGNCPAPAAECPAGSFSIGSSLTCSQCDSQCDAQGCASSANWCYKCALEGAITNITSCTCPPNTFEYKKLNKCVNCPAECTTCSLDSDDNFICSECQENYTLNALT